MIKFVLTCLIFISTSRVYAKLYSKDDSQHKSLWEEFKLKYNKEYESKEEELKRLTIFINNLKLIDERNQKEQSIQSNVIHDITKFADLSIDEFKSKYLTVDKKNIKSLKKSSNKHSLKNDIIPNKLVDWAGIYTTPVKNQGDCGGCWAFSAVEQVESDTIRQQGLFYILSPGQVIECAEANGCDGGNVQLAYEYIKETGGLDTEDDYPSQPYSNEKNPPTCDNSNQYYVTTITSYETLESEDEMTAYVQSTGPLSVCVEASSWQFYSSGVYAFCSYDVDHCVQAVGVLPKAAIDGGYWKIRNSWGVDWGEDGFIRIPWGKDACGITTIPTYTNTAPF
mmetsp:Transcript_18803/g.17019  ORF Transcript_18803/g.17019 Transcript_18803/m.17019 type:complete len:338 (-) Transcript_18803:127-1140(-)